MRAWVFTACAQIEENRGTPRQGSRKGWLTWGKSLCAGKLNSSTAVPDASAPRSAIQSSLNGSSAESVADGVQCGVQAIPCLKGLLCAVVEKVLLYRPLRLIPA